MITVQEAFEAAHDGQFEPPQGGFGCQLVQRDRDPRRLADDRAGRARRVRAGAAAGAANCTGAPLGGGKLAPGAVGEPEDDGGG